MYFLVTALLVGAILFAYMYDFSYKAMRNAFDRMLYGTKESFEDVPGEMSFVENDPELLRDAEVIDGPNELTMNAAPVDAESTKELTIEDVLGSGDEETSATVLSDGPDSSFLITAETEGSIVPKKADIAPEDLLPKDDNSDWAAMHPSGEGLLSDKNFLDAGFHLGVMTTGQTNKIPNLDIRSLPPNPRSQVSPWSQSTVEPDTMRRRLEIGV